MSFSTLLHILKGGTGSGNFGHAGRPGKRGGSASGGLSVLSDFQDIKDRIGTIIDYATITRDEMDDITYAGPSGTDGIMKVITSKLGLEEKPKLVDKISPDSVELYRNYRRESSLKRFLEDEPYYAKGAGQNFGTGIYAANDIRQADAISDYGAIKTRMGLVKDAKVVNYRDLEKMRGLFRSELDGPISDGSRAAKRLDEIVNDPGRFAAILGYDAIKVPYQGMKGYENEYVIVNRGALEVEKELL